MDYDNMKLLFGFLCLLLNFAGQCMCNVCNKEELKSCLTPSLQYLRNTSTIYGTHAGFLESTVAYFFTLSDTDLQNYHTGSFKTTMLKLDDIFNHHRKLESGCRFFTTAEICLHIKKQWCDGEIRGVLEGIENVFNFICHEEYMEDFENNQACILGSAMENARLTCNSKLIQSLNVIDKMSDVCSPVKEALGCVRDSTKAICGESSAKWEYRLRHDLVQLPLNDVCKEQDDYDYLESLEECFECTNGGKCVPTSLTCDGHKHCLDGSDEAHTLCGHHWGTLDTTLIIAGLIIVIAITILCVIKYRENIEYTLKHRLQWRSREMQVFMNDAEEESSSISSSQNRAFHYDKLTHSEESEVYNV